MQLDVYRSRAAVHEAKVRTSPNLFTVSQLTRVVAAQRGTARRQAVPAAKDARATTASQSLADRQSGRSSRLSSRTHFPSLSTSVLAADKT